LKSKEKKVRRPKKAPELKNARRDAFAACRKVGSL